MKNSSVKFLILLQISVCVFGSAPTKAAALQAEMDPALAEILLETQEEKKQRCIGENARVYDECCRLAPGCGDTRHENACTKKGNKAEQDCLSAPSPQSPTAPKSVTLDTPAFNASGASESPTDACASMAAISEALNTLSRNGVNVTANASMMSAMTMCLPPGGLSAREELIKRLLKWAKARGCDCGDPKRKKNLTPEEAKKLVDCINGNRPKEFPELRDGWNKEQVCKFLAPLDYDQSDCDWIWDGGLGVVGLNKADCDGDGKISAQELTDFLQSKGCAFPTQSSFTPPSEEKLRGVVACGENAIAAPPIL